MKKIKKAQNKLINELKNQILVQAELLGVRDRFTPVVLAELKVDAARKILSEFYAERSNLEYELNMLGSQKKDLLIKLERLNAYIIKAEAITSRHARQIEDLIEKGMGDMKKTRRALRRVRPVRVSAAA
jgi:hypothetical protein